MKRAELSQTARLQDAARKHSRHGHRDTTAILIAYRHGLRASELCELTWNMIELDSGRIHVRRAKNGVDSTHPLTGDTWRTRRERPRGRAADKRDELATPHVWMAPAWQEIIWRAAQRSLAVMCPACWCSPGGLLALMGYANRVLIIRTGSMSR